MDQLRQKVYRGWRKLQVNCKIEEYRLRDAPDGWQELEALEGSWDSDARVTVIMEWADGTSVTEELSRTQVVWRGSYFDAEPWFRYNAAAGVAFVGVVGE